MVFGYARSVAVDRYAVVLYKNYRPTLIISDDLDDPEKLLNPEVRKKDQDWFDTDFLRAGALDGSYQLCEYRHDQARGGQPHRSYAIVRGGQRNFTRQ